MYQLNAIGRLKKEMSGITLRLGREFRRGLKFIELFSHIHVFYAEERGENTVLSEKIMEVLSADKKNGILKLCCNDWKMEQAYVFDLKPYIPCEDSVRKSSCISYNSDHIQEAQIKEWQAKSGQGMLPQIGKVRKNNGKIYLQLDSEYQLSAFSGCSHIKLIWWFHKFDSAAYRGCVECSPPYENAPRTGVFATRSPVRPNLLAMTITRVLKYDINMGRIYIQDAECFDMTPCIAIWPYCEQSDLIREARVAFWMEQWPKWLNEGSADTVKGKLDSHSRNPQEISGLCDEAYKEEWEKLLAEDEQSENTAIYVKGARENNLKGIDCSIPYRKVTAVVGVSGSGKSSLVQDTIYAECKRRMGCLTEHDSDMKKPNIDSISGAIPAVLISQKEIGKNSRSTVGTYSNAYDYLRMIYALCGIRYCPQCGERIERDSLVCRRCERLLFELTPASFNYTNPESMCPVCNGSGEKEQIDITGIIEDPKISILDGASSWWGKLRNFIRNPNANWMKGQVIGLAQKMNVDLEAPWCELPEEFRHQLLYGSGTDPVVFNYTNKKNGRKGEICRPVEGVCHIIERLCSEKNNTALTGKFIKKVLCDYCQGERLNAEGRLVSIGNIRYPQAAGMTFAEIIQWCRTIPALLERKEAERVKGYVQKLFRLALCAEELGIGHLELSRSTASLSGGEAQRMKFLAGMQNQLSGVLYVLDEPSKGLHPKDYSKIAGMINRLKQNGNTVLMVEHNEDMIRIADQLIEIGPKPGEKGGYLIGEGSIPQLLMHSDSQTVRYMKKREQLIIYRKKDPETLSWMCIHGARYHNLKNITVTIPVHAITCICGVSGSGKSSLVNGVLFQDISKLIRGDRNLEFCDSIENADIFARIVMIEQSAIGKTPRSVPATYMGVMDEIRELFAMTREAEQAGLTAAAFSFNSSSGQCAKCRGEGQIQPGFLRDIWVTCPDCKGKRYQKQILDITFRGRNIYDVLEMSVDEAADFFKSTETICRVLDILREVGLGYLKLGQSSTALSGGEASRLKLAKELAGKDNAETLYLIDEPTTGLHFSDVGNLLRLFQKLIDNGSTIILIEHNKQILDNCDWLIELGPGAGKEGGYVVSVNGNMEEMFVK